MSTILCINHRIVFQWRFKVAISPSIDCPGVHVGCGTSTWRLIRFSGGEGWGGDSVEVEGPELLLPVGVGPGEWRELPGVGDWEDGGWFRLRFFLRLCLLFGWWSAVTYVGEWVNIECLYFVEFYLHEIAVLLSTSSLSQSILSPFQPVATEDSGAH